MVGLHPYAPGVHDRPNTLLEISSRNELHRVLPGALATKPRPARVDDRPRRRARGAYVRKSKPDSSSAAGPIETGRGRGKIPHVSQRISGWT
jgi:hypothetical protein